MNSVNESPEVADFSQVPERLAALQVRIDAALAKRRLTHPDAPADHSVRLIGVTKRHPLAAIEAGYASGVRDFGENYAQEFRDKAAAIAARGDEFADLRWHFIGQLQRNKIKYVLGRALIHTVDRLALVTALGAKAAAAGVTQEFLVEVNAGEAQKGGVSPGELPALLEAVGAHANLRCVGLMTMAPLSDSGDQTGAARRAFEACAALRDQYGPELRSRPGSNVDLRELSMGMSGDFEVAIEAGATMVRVGSALFGARPSR